MVGEKLLEDGVVWDVEAVIAFSAFDGKGGGFYAKLTECRIVVALNNDLFNRGKSDHAILVLETLQNYFIGLGIVAKIIRKHTNRIQPSAAHKHDNYTQHQYA